MKLIHTLLFILAFGLAAPAFGANQVDVNSADAKTLAQALQGIGLVKAEAIVAYRNAHGPFQGIEDLAKVKGIGRRIVEENRSVIVFGKSMPEASPHGGTGQPHMLSTW
jgi:competence protein ComEA